MIDFISAKNGGIELFSGVGVVVGFAKDAKTLAGFMERHGVASAVYASSTMDFADEEGFAHHDDANKLWNQAVDIYNWNVNKVA
jgi:hypothetical protein